MRQFGGCFGFTLDWIKQGIGLGVALPRPRNETSLIHSTQSWVYSLAGIALPARIPRIQAMVRDVWGMPNNVLGNGALHDNSLQVAIGALANGYSMLMIHGGHTHPVEHILGIRIGGPGGSLFFDANSGVWNQISGALILAHVNGNYNYTHWAIFQLQGQRIIRSREAP